MIQFDQDSLSEILAGLSNQKKSPQDVIYEMIDETRDYYQEVVLTGSTINSLSINPFFWATKALLGVSFNSNINMVFGDICHSFVQFCNQNKLDDRPTDFKEGLLFAIKKGRISYYKNIPIEKRLSTNKDYKSLFAIYKEVKVICSLFFKNIHPTTSPISVEKRLKYQLVDETDRPLNILLSGQYDWMEEGIMVDLKTSRFNIMSETLVDETLEEYKDELKALQKKMAKDDKEKQLEQNVKDANLKPSKTELQESLEFQIKESNKILKLKRPTDEEKAQAQEIIDSCEKQLDEEFKKIATEQQSAIFTAEVQLKAYVSSIEAQAQRRIEKLELIIQPLQEDLDRRQHFNDSKIAKKKHGKQLALYALLEMLINGRKIVTGRVVLFLRNKIPRVRVFEFNIEDEIKRLVGEISDIVELINLWRSGTPSRILFRANHDTYIGSELMNILEAIEASEDSEEEFVA